MKKSRAIVVKHSSLPEPVIVVPADASADDLRDVLRLLTDVAGLDAEIVSVVVSASAAAFRKHVAAFAAEATQGGRDRVV